jgi:hypothetical protein
MRVALVALCGCNSVFGVQTTNKRDATMPYYDAPADAPFACPPLGTPPKFSSVLHQVIAQYCTDYTISSATGLAAASCYRPNMGQDISLGPVDTLPAQILPYDYQDQHSEPRLSPEGDDILVYGYLSASYMTQFEEFRASGGTWSRTYVLPLPPTASAITAPTRSPDRHVLVVETDSQLHEFRDNGGNSWTETAAHSTTELGVAYPGSPALTPDGLRLLLYAAPTTDPSTYYLMYTDRAALDLPFRPAVPLYGAPAAPDVFMTEDCGRIYMSALQSVFYVEQQ